MFEIPGRYTTAKVMIDEIDSETASQIHLFVNHPAFTHPVAIMPDTHAGKGSVIGFTMPLGDKVIPNVVGVDIGCFTGETKVALLDGRSLSFVDLMKEDQAGKVNFCYSKNGDGEITISRIERPRQTRTTTKLIEVTLDNGETVSCTPDHIFYLKDGTEAKAEDLIAGNSLFPLYVELVADVDGQISKPNLNHDMSDYLAVYNPKSGQYDFVHILADEYNIRQGLYESASHTVRHHADFNKRNNNPTNIERVLWKDHFQIHSEAVSESNRKGTTGFGKAWKTSREKMRRQSSAKMTKLHQRPDFQERLRVRAAKTMSEYCQTGLFKERSKVAGKRGRKYLTRYAQSPKGRAKSREMAAREYECPICHIQVRSAIGVHNHIKKKHEFETLSFSDFKLVLNHKVVSVREIECDKMPVYCLTTEHGNFALASGVFVHNCGMLSLNVGSELHLSLEEFDHKIRQRVPFGMNVHESHQLKMKTDFPWSRVRVLAEKFCQAFIDTYGVRLEPPVYDIDWFERKCRDMEGNTGRMINSLGTLGGGNHFIETGASEKGDYWVTIHTGSRNWGKRVCDLWQHKAVSNLNQERKVDLQAEIAKIKTETTDGKEIFRRIKELKAGVRNQKEARKGIDITGREWLEGEDAAGYLFDMIFAQVYAEVNRFLIGYQICKILGISDPHDRIETVHNFIDFKDFIVRKGAIRAYEGEKMIIPFNMRDGILVCEGKSNPEWNFSAPHGAGRVMSRSQAKKRLDVDTFKTQMEGIYSTSVGNGTLDESPDAYKDSAIIEEAIEPTAIIVDRIKPIHNMKDSSDSTFRKRKE